MASSVNFLGFFFVMFVETLNHSVTVKQVVRIVKLTGNQTGKQKATQIAAISTNIGGLIGSELEVEIKGPEIGYQNLIGTDLAFLISL